MKAKRIIARLDIKGPNVVKGIHLEGLRVLGKPSEFAKFYYEQGADEILFMDVVASLYERNSLHHIISETAKDTFVPITVGGGLRTIDDIRDVLRAGADKVCLNTAAINNPDVIKRASTIFGSSTIVVAIEAIKESDGRYLAYTDNGREYTGVEVIEWAKEVESLGAGEIIITSVDAEGTGEGFDCFLSNEVASSVSIPVIAHGGSGKIKHIVEVFENTTVDGVSLASILHYEFVQKHSAEINDSQEGNTEFLKQKRSFHNFEPTNIDEVKKVLMEHNVRCRIKSV